MDYFSRVISGYPGSKHLFSFQYICVLVENWFKKAKQKTFLFLCVVMFIVTRQIEFL